MTNTNDHIIDEVFQAILKNVGPNSQEFAFYNSMKMANLPIDNRMLANLIIQDFPWPIGVELRRLFSGDLRNRDKNRVDQILRTAEKFAQFFSYCLIIQLWDEAKLKSIELSKDFESQFAHIDKPSFGVYVGLIRAIHNIFEKENIDPFVSYNTDSFNFKNFIQNFNNLVTMRNEDRHHTSEMDCQEGEDLLKNILIDLAVISKYKLITIKDIKVMRPKLKPVAFQHSMRMLNSQHEDFSSSEQSFDTFSDSHSVLLVQDVSSPKAQLNLSPFVVDTSTMLENQRIPGIKNGIYVYNQLKEDKYIYILTNVAEPAVFNSLPHFNFLKDQFDDLLLTLNGNKVAAVT